ncbi:MAG: hypothetical protein KA821_06980 [Chitinophagaceae bacterium]|nr:hypothetical protein [Chitinophagaceae bacterium]
MKGFQDNFIQFLFDDKQFPKEGLMMGISFSDQLFQPDIKVVDDNMEFVCQFQFMKVVTDKTKYDLAEHILANDSENLPFFIVKEEPEASFSLLSLLPDRNWKVISKEDFPSYTQLLKLKKAEAQKSRASLEKAKRKDIESIKEKNKTTAYFSLISVIVGLITIIISYFGFGLFKTSNNNELQAKFDNLSEKIKSLEGRFKSDTNQLTIVPIDSAAFLKTFETRLSSIENSISSDPNQLITIISLQKELDMLKVRLESHKSEEQTHTDSLNQRFDSLNSWVIGIAITVFGAILSFVLPTLRKDKNNVR